MPAEGTPIYRFEAFELDPAERRLLSAGQSIALTPKVFDTLVLLVERAGRVVSKEEIIQTIWPRGFVDESNLTKHIWLIRRALGEKEHRTTRFIETVPKLGYRFVAAVSVGSASTPARPPPEPAVVTAAATTAPPETHGHRRWALATGLLFGMVVICGAVWRWWPASTPASDHPGQTVAFAGFQNLSGNPKDAWVAPALTDMLVAELLALRDIRVVPEELVRDAGAGLSPPVATGYSMQTLKQLARRLDADYVVSGSYFVMDASADSPVRVELAVQDAHSGALLVARKFDSPLARLTSLVSDAGALLRDKLARTPADPQTLSLIANARPPNVEMARRVGFALDALAHDDAARARDELLEAIAEAPGYPLAYMHLAQAWAALGYRDKALAAAEQAARYAVNLPPEQRLQVQAMVAVTRSDWTHAIAAWQSLVKVRPLDIEYRLRSIDAQIRASHADKARESIEALRQLPDAQSDPRVELAASHIAQALEDTKGEGAHAALALRQAQAHETPGLLADAQLQLAHARSRLGELPETRRLLEAAISGYRDLKNPRGEAQAHLAMGNLAWSEHHVQTGREEFQQAMALYRSIGDQAGMASVYRDTCGMLWTTGDRDGAQAAAREALAIARDIGDASLQTWTLRALATIASDDGATDEVVDEYREVLALSQKVDDPGGHVWSLASLADIERLRGELSEASVSCARAQAEAGALSDPQFSIYSGFTCALIAVDKGDVSRARAALDQVVQQSTATQYPVYADDARMTLAQLDMDEHQWAAARDKLRGASRGFEADEVETGEADAMALLALCEQALGDGAQRDQAAARARKLRESITSRQEVYLVDIALAQLDANRNGADVRKLLALAADAQHRHFVAWALEARLAAWQILEQHGGGRAADTLRVQLAEDARRQGFARILTRLHSSAPSGENLGPAGLINQQLLDSQFSFAGSETLRGPNPSKDTYEQLTVTSAQMLPFTTLAARSIPFRMQDYR